MYLVTRFACDIRQGFGFEFHLRSSPSAFSGFVNISKRAEYFTTCYTLLTRTRSKQCVVAALSFLRSISLASLLFTSLSIFG